MTEARDALAVALVTNDLGYWDDSIRHDTTGDEWHRFADAILAALPDGWVLARTQDAEDGAALRRLREAAPTVGGLIRTDFRPEHRKTYGEPEFYVQVEWWNGHDRRVEGAYGPTISAAASKAREALR